jgi:hypothetical protein
MKPADHILLAQLLREREAAFVTVWECELRIRRRLGGGEFPFPAPPDLPSQRRRPRPAPPAPSSPAAALRRLRPGEDAYCLTCLCGGARHESLSDTPEAVRALVSGAPADLTLLRLDTVALDAAGVPALVECLWSSDSNAAASSS